MCNYTIEPKEVSVDNIKENGFKLTPSNNRIFQDNNYKLLKNIIDNNLIGFEIGSINYVINSNKRFIKTNNITQNFLFDFSSVEYMKIDNTIKNNVVQLKHNDIVIAKDGGGEGLGECSLYLNTSFEDYMSGSGLILRIKEDMKRFYILGILKSKHFKEYINNKTPIASTLRHSNTISLNYKLEDFDIKNQKHLILSYLTQNIIDKEEQIKIKNIIIDNLIENELEVSQSNSNVSADKSMFIENDFRFNAGLYNQEYLDIYNSILNFRI